MYNSDHSDSDNFGAESETNYLVTAICHSCLDIVQFKFIIIIIIRQPLCPVVGRRPQHAISKLPCHVLSSAISCRSSICPGRLSKQAMARVISLAAGSIVDAAMIISTKKSKVMHIHKTTRTSATTEADVAKLNLVHKCESCACEFTKLRGLKIHMALWCDGGRTQRSRVGSLTDKAIKSSKSRAAEASLDNVVIGSDPPLENMPHFQYLGSRLQGDGSDEADVDHRLEIVQSAFSSLSHLWADHRLSRTTKLRLYRVCVCSSLTHCREAWTLNRTVTRSINGFNSRCLHVMTGEHYRETATAPA